jgi:hypothetical protein
MTRRGSLMFTADKTMGGFQFWVYLETYPKPDYWRVLRLFRTNRTLISDHYVGITEMSKIVEGESFRSVP